MSLTRISTGSLKDQDDISEGVGRVFRECGLNS